MTKRSIWVVKDATDKQLEELAHVAGAGDKVIFVGEVPTTKSFLWRGLPRNKALIPNKNLQDRTILHKFSRVVRPDSGLIVRAPSLDSPELHFKLGLSNKNPMKYCATTLLAKDIPVGKVWRIDQLIDFLYKK